MRPAPRTAIILGALAWLLSGCATNPVSGQREFSLMSEAQEIAIGQQADEEIRREMGVYDDPALQRYVQDIGMRLAKVSERPHLPWHFAIVDSPAVNAFALPGGYIYVTRGLMAYLHTEAELAAVIGHEIGHVTARHSARRYSQSTAATLGLVLGSVFFPEIAPYADAAGTGLGLLFLKYSRDDEIQADRLGAGYIAREGWKPGGMQGVLQTLGRLDDATDRRGIPNWLSTHPQPADRVARAEDLVAALEASPPPQGWQANRAGYLERLEGLMFGDNPKEGIVRGARFLHPDLRFRVDFPEGWVVNNGKTQVVVQQPTVSDAVILLELVDNPQGQPLARLASATMSDAGYLPIDGTETRINGLPAYVGTYQGQTQQGALIGVEAGHIAHVRQVFLLAGLASERRFSQTRRLFDRVIGSFAPLSEAEASAIKPNRLTFVAARAGDDWDTLAARAGDVVSGKTLALINGRMPGEEPEGGQRIKIIVSRQ